MYIYDPVLSPVILIVHPSSFRVRMSGDLSYEWSWKQLLAENIQLLAKAWGTLLKFPVKAEEIPEEHISCLLCGRFLGS